MPAKLEEFLHEDIPFLWDKIKEQYTRFMDYGVEKLGVDSIYILVGIGVILLCFIIGIAVHNANKRDRAYLNDREQKNPIEEAIATCDYESIVNGNKNAASYLITEVSEEAPTDFEEATEVATEAAVEDIKPMMVSDSINWVKPEKAPWEEEEAITSEFSNPVTINMEKIEIVRQEDIKKETFGIKYNVSRTGKTYTEEELKELIKD